MQIRAELTRLDGVLLLTPTRIFPDDRGFFVETYRENAWSELGLPRFVQENHSRSARGVLRGVHLNQANGGQGKLVRCVRGRIWDVAVDLRPEASSFGEWQGFELSDDNHQQLYVPPRFGHGFCVLSEVADVTYKLTAYYQGATEIGVRWDDPALGIDWPLANPTVSERDRTSPLLNDLRPQLSLEG